MFQYHQKVMTPKGAGMIQGKLKTKDMDGNPLEKIPVSRPRGKNQNGVVDGIWYLEAYLPEDITPIEEA